MPFLNLLFSFIVSLVIATILFAIIKKIFAIAIWVVKSVLSLVFAPIKYLLAALFGWLF